MPTNCRRPCPRCGGLCRLGYRYEPGLLVAAFVLSLLAALPDALIAVWLTLLGRGVLEDDQRLLFGRRHGAGRVRGGDLVPP